MKYKVALLVIIFGVLTFMSYGCGLSVQNPIVKSPDPLNVKVAIDTLCQSGRITGNATDTTNFWDGLMDGYYLNRKQTAFTAQELDDIAKWRVFCAMDPAARTSAQYGMVVGRFADDIMARSMPFLGADVLAIVRAAGVMP
jgi:hypothetical protein